MRILSRSKLRDYWEKHPEVEQQLRTWYSVTKESRWENTADVLAKCRNARPLNAGRIVFKIHGNRYRLVVQVNYAYGKVYIRFIGTHAEYDKINAETI